MWNRVYNRNGKVVAETAAFKETLGMEHQVTTMAEMLDTDFRQIPDGTLFSADVENEITNFITDGSIDVDTTRGTRRTSELTLLNPTAEFTPATEEFDPQGKWVGKIYLNRMVRISRGVYVGGQRLYVPVGTFMVDECDVLVEQNMSLVNLVLSDRWKMIAKSFYGNNHKYPTGTLYTEIIVDMLQSAGINLQGRFGANLDNLHGRTLADRKTNANIKFVRGDSRGDKLKELCDGWDIDAYFDPLGIFTTQDRRDRKDQEVVWTFRSSPLRLKDGEYHNGMLVSLRRSFNDDNLYNHVIIVGTGNKKNVVRAERRDIAANSMTNIDRIGDRIYLKESEKYSTQSEVNNALNRVWRKRVQLSESIEAQVISNPMLEGDDVIRIVERDKAKLDGTYRLQRFSIPLMTSRQTLTAVNIIHGDDL